MLRCYLSTFDAAPLQVHDVPEEFADRRIMGAWQERASAWGAPAQVAMPTYFAEGGHRVFVLGRAEPVHPRRAVAGARPAPAADRARPAGRRPSAGSPPVPTRRGPTGLTVRELTVLGLVAEGLTAAAAARRLAVTEGTVHKHLQNAYRKLGVRDRLGAVLRAQQMGVLQAQGGWAADGPGG